MNGLREIGVMLIFLLLVVFRFAIELLWSISCSFLWKNQKGASQGFSMKDFGNRQQGWQWHAYSKVHARLTQESVNNFKMQEENSDWRHSMESEGWDLVTVRRGPAARWAWGRRSHWTTTMHSSALKLARELERAWTCMCVCDEKHRWSEKRRIDSSSPEVIHLNFCLYWLQEKLIADRKCLL